MEEQSKKIEEVEAADVEESTYTAPKAKSRKKKFGKKEVLMIVIPALAAVAAVIVASFFVKKASIQKTGGTGRQYYMGTENKVDAGTVIKKSEDGKDTIIEEGKKNVALADLPIYYDDRDAFMITEDMIWNDPRSGERKRVDHFTELTVAENGTVTASYGGVQKTANRGFLYNGKDMYVFLEPVTVHVDGYTIELPALSYVEASYGDALVTFNYETKESEAFNADKPAQADAGDYMIELFSDTVILSDGKRRLLFTAPDKMKPLITAE